MIFMNQMLGVIHHMHCGCRIIPGEPWYDNNDISKVFLKRNVTSVSALNFTALVFKTSLFFCPCSKAILNKEMLVS